MDQIQASRRTQLTASSAVFQWNKLSRRLLGLEVQAVTSPQRVMIQSSHLTPELTNITKEGVQGPVPGLSERLLGGTAGWDSLSNSRSGLRLLEQIRSGKLLTESHNLGGSGFGGPQLPVRQAEEL